MHYRMNLRSLRPSGLAAVAASLLFSGPLRAAAEWAPSETGSHDRRLPRWRGDRSRRPHHPIEDRGRSGKPVIIDNRPARTA